ncbi:hypothetical protein DINM_006909 [Dirofilaria immitis]|nr:hypothetical protein [Dirofilaria immitis]
MNLIRTAFMTSATLQKKKDYDPGVVGMNLQQQEMKRRRDWLKIRSFCLAKKIFMGILTPHSTVVHVEPPSPLQFPRISFEFVTTIPIIPASILVRLRTYMCHNG